MKLPKKIPKKLVVTGIALMLSVAVLGGVSYAWYTISSTPEVSAVKVGIYADRTILVSTDGENFGQYINLSDAFNNLVGLHPVSTADGLHWFLPAYQVEGMLMDAEEFSCDTTLANANVSILGDDGKPLTGDALQKRQEQGYYYYVDFYLMTEVEGGCTVHLSFPEKDSFDDLLTEEGVQGTYVLGNPKLVNDPETGPRVSLSNAGASCIRIGFLTNPAYSEESGLDSTGYTKIYPKNGFVIYEPNADLRTSASKPGSGDSAEAGRYILGSDFSMTAFASGNYMETMPIGMVTGENGKETPEPVHLNPDRLIVQKSSSWNENRLFETLVSGAKPTSADIGAFGYFLNARFLYDRFTTVGTSSSFVDVRGEAGGNGSGESIITLVQDEPVKVRMFLWLEGQDPDCWNDVSGSSFRMNLELTGRE